ncbi:tryptophan halogenase family protein [Shewanella sp. KT0246]|uniref:tryptophan halogenase family protein n=1 Tax=Shewanella sp. KT0246 TaxID=2815912 RepID=UPI001BB9F3E4|nr:tryptophan halogenase family protein [Shewanella sp. KT0246]GIU51619.1 tryptophan halogenase [Shewanella sp. KT0246]
MIEVDKVNKEVQRIVIIGGGTAGWLAANHIGIAAQLLPNVTVTLIESPDIPTIGVGEGTVPAIKQSLQSFGIRETDFIRDCDVSFKQSIKFCNWLDKTKHGENNSYHHLFDVPSPLGADLTPQWLHQQATHSNSSTSYSQNVSPQHYICEALKAPKLITTPEYGGKVSYAYHLNAAKFAKLLASNATSKLGVQHLQANVLDADIDDEGNLTQLKTDKLGELAFDFFIDCSGFESILLTKKLQVPFVDKSKQLFVNKAIVAQVPITEEYAIPPYTIATAHQAGWVWDIALPERRGTGFVYSDNHMTSSEAEQKFDRYLGGKLASLASREIPMKVGYREKFWFKNCVALGLAQGFLEPIEATSILLTDFAAGYLAKRLPQTMAQMPALSERFNNTMTYAWERVVEFAKLHYCISDRTDSDFWIDNRHPESIPEPLKHKMALWQNYSPLTDDLFSRFEVFNIDNYLYVLYGMKYQTKAANLSESYHHIAQQQIAQIEKIGKGLAAELPEHRALLNKIKQFGLKTI